MLYRKDHSLTNLLWGCVSYAVQIDLVHGLRLLALFKRIDWSR